MPSDSSATAPLVVAHRGLSARFPEHTRPAYQEAVAFADAFECDVRLTRDGVLVCWHDGSLNRTSDLSGRVSATSWSDMSAATPEPLRFEALLDIALEAGKSLLVETKHPVRYAGKVERVLHDVLELQAPRIQRAGIDVHLMSFSTRAVRRFRPELGTPVQLVDKARVRVPVSHAPTVGVDYRLLTAAYISGAHARGQRVFAWTVNDMAAATCLANWGVDAIITDCADQVRAALG